jgi:hypothetical protein
MLDDVTVRLGADDRKARKGIGGFGRFLDKEMAAWVERGTLTGRNAGKGFAAGLEKHTKPAIANLSKAMLGATAVAGAAASAAQLAGAVAPLAASIAAAGAALPAFAAGGAAALGTLKLGFTGLGEAIAGDEEALEKLAPAGKEVVGVLSGLAPAWDDVTKSVQGALFKGVAKDIADLAQTWLPLLRGGLTHVAKGWNQVASAAAEGLKQTAVIEGFSSVVGNTAEGLQSFAKGVQPLLRGVGVLLTAFSPLLLEAGQAAAGLAERFADWAEEAQRTGQLTQMIETMKSTLSTLGGIVSNVGSILSSVFGTAAQEGGGFLGVVESLTGKIADFLKSADGQKTLTSLFSSLATIGAALAPVVFEIAKVLGTQLAPKIAEIATGLGPELKDFFTTLGDALSRIDIGPLVTAAAELLNTFTPLLIPLAEIINLIVMLSPLLTPLAIGLAIWTVSQWAINAAMLANPILLIITAIILLIGAIVWIATQTTWFQDIWDACWSGIKAAAKAVADWWTGAFMPGLTGALSAIGDAAVSAKDTIVSGFNAVVSFVKGLPGRISSAASGMWDGIKNAFKSALNWLIGKWNDLSFSVPSIDMGPLGEVGGFTVSTPNIPMLADGAIVTGPTLAMIGEGAHDEAVVPLPKGARQFAAAGGGGGGVITLRLTGDLLRVLREDVAARGGNVQTVIGDGEA